MESGIKEDLKHCTYQKKLRNAKDLGPDRKVGIRRDSLFPPSVLECFFSPGKSGRKEKRLLQFSRMLIEVCTGTEYVHLCFNCSPMRLYSPYLITYMSEMLLSRVNWLKCGGRDVAQGVCAIWFIQPGKCYHGVNLCVSFNRQDVKKPA